MCDLYNMGAKELYALTKSKLYRNLPDGHSNQVWITGKVWVSIRGIDFLIKADKVNNQPVIFLYHTKDDEIDINILDNFKTVKNLCLAVDKELLSLGKKLLGYDCITKNNQICF